jgi:hypothetical protein
VQLYQGLIEAAQQLSSLLTAAGTALALGGGIILGEYLATLLSRAVRLPQSCFCAPLFADPPSLQSHK